MSGDCKISELKKRHLGKCRFILFLEKFINNDSFEDLEGNSFLVKEIKCKLFKITHYTENLVLEKNNFSSILTRNHFPELENDFLSLPEGDKFSVVTTENR